MARHCNALPTTIQPHRRHGRAAESTVPRRAALQIRVARSRRSLPLSKTKGWSSSPSATNRATSTQCARWKHPRHLAIAREHSKIQRTPLRPGIVSVSEASNNSEAPLLPEHHAAASPSKPIASRDPRLHSQIDAVVTGRHSDPFGFLGPHAIDGGWAIRFFIPWAEEAQISLQPPATESAAHLVTLEGVRGVQFAVWAPSAKRVSVVGDFNRWDGRVHPLRARGSSGIWEIFIPELAEGAIYKFEIIGPDGNMLPLKADPYAFRSELRPNTGSIVANLENYLWNDSDWLLQRS